MPRLMPWARPAGSSRASDPALSAAAKGHRASFDNNLDVVAPPVEDISPHSSPVGKENGVEPAAKRRKIALRPVPTPQRRVDSVVRQPAPPQHTSIARCPVQQHVQILQASPAQSGTSGLGPSLEASRRPISAPAVPSRTSQPAQDDAPAAANQAHVAGALLPQRALCANHGTLR